MLCTPEPAAPPRPLTSGFRFPGEPRFLSRAGPPAGMASGVAAPAFLPGPTSGLGFPGTCSRLPPPPRGQGRPQGWISPVPSRLQSPAPGSVPFGVSGGDSLRAVDLPRTPQEADAGASGLAEPPGRPRNLHSLLSPVEAALETAVPATSLPATAPRLRTRAGQSAAENYRKAPTHHRGATPLPASPLRIRLSLPGS